MAPSGAGLFPVGYLLLWMLAALGWVRAEPNVTASVDSQCSRLDDHIEAAINFGTPQPNVTLGPGCHFLTRNFACTPIRSSLAVVGSENDVSTWDTKFDLYQFSVEPGVVLTLRNLVLSRALVFTTVNSDLLSSSQDPRALQPAMFHMRAGSRMVLQNVTVQTRCSTLTYYWNNLPWLKPPATIQPPPLSFENITIGAVTLQNVTVCCQPGLELSGPVDLYVHSVPMLKAFLAAASSLSIRAIFHVLENLTLPHVPPSAYVADTADQRDWLVTADTVITGEESSLTYIDSNFTAAWLTVQWPARLTLRKLMLTQLFVKVVAPGGSNGLIASALPLPMVQVPGSATLPTRYLEDVTLVVPQYEVVEMTYWCIMVNVGTPEVKHVSDFLRPYVWPIDFDILDSTQLYLARVRTESSMYVRVLLTSRVPPNVPFTDSGPPPTVLTYQHVQPPLFIIGTGKDWADAVAPVLPQDTWSSLQAAAAAAAGGTSSSAAGPSASGSGSDSLPALVLINGTVTLQLSDLQVTRNGGVRVIRRSAVITSMRQGCGSSDPSCPLAILDMGGFMNMMRFEGPSTTVVFMGLTLRNFSSTISPQTVNSATANQNSIGGFFIFDRSYPQVSFESVTVEVNAELFAGLYLLVTLRPRGGSAGDVNVIFKNESFIQLASFQFGGVRGSYVNFTLVGGKVDLSAQKRDDATEDEANRGSSDIVPIAAGTVVGCVCMLVLVLGGLLLIRAHRRRLSSGAATEKSASLADIMGDMHRDSRSTNRSAGGDGCLEGGGVGTDSTFANVLCAKGAPTGSSSTVAAVEIGGAMTTTELSRTCERVKISDEESPQCTTLTVSDLNSSETAMTLQAVSQMVVPPPPMALSVVGVSGQMPRRVFSLARSVPEEGEFGADASMDSSIRGTGSGCSTSAGGVGRRLLMDAANDTTAAVAAAAAAAAAAAVAAAVVGNPRSASRILPSLLDPPTDTSGRGSGGGSGSGASARRMMRMPSGGRPHTYGLGEFGRSPGIRVRAALGRSPSRPARSAASSSGGPSVSLPAPQPAILTAPASPNVTIGPPATAPVRFKPDRIYNCQNQHLRHDSGGGQRREASNPTLIRSVGDAAAVTGSMITGMSACTELAGGACEATTSHSVQLMATGGTLDPISGPNLDAEIISPGVSTSLSKVPEPASEVQRLIQELSTSGTDQLVILEPIGQGGYGMVYRGVWRNLDVAVKTILFQDRANLTSPHVSCAATACVPNNGHTMQASVVEESEEGSQKNRPSRPGSAANPGHCVSTGTNGCGAPTLGAAGVGGMRDIHGSGGGTGGTHNWALASQQAANSGSLPSVNVGGAGPPGVASQQRAVLEAAVSCSVAHPNVVATYHYDIAPIRPSGVVCSGGLLISDGSHMRGGCGAVPGALVGGPGAVSDWKLYLVQEFCDAGSLANALDARAFHDPSGMPNLALTLCALADIARGMAHIHSRSIVHGDLNPTNILLRSVSGSNGGIVPMWNRVALAGGNNAGGAGGGGGGSGTTTPGGSISAAAQLRHELGVTLVAKVADFGLCGMLAPGKRHISNALRGTPFYTAPETVATGTLTKASDVYSFGVIAWEVYTGRPPFQHVPKQGFVRNEIFPRLPPHVPATFANMTLACVSNEPDSRPTFDQILERLMSLQSKLAVSLQQRLSRLMAGGGAFLGTASPLGPGTASSTPHGSATPTSVVPPGVSLLGPGLPCYFIGNGSGQSVSMPPQPVCSAGMGMGMGMGVATVAMVAGDVNSPGLLASCGGVPNFPLSTPCVLPAAVLQPSTTEADVQ